MGWWAQLIRAGRVPGRFAGSGIGGILNRGVSGPIHSLRGCGYCTGMPLMFMKVGYSLHPVRCSDENFAAFMGQPAWGIATTLRDFFKGLLPILLPS